MKNTKITHTHTHTYSLFRSIFFVCLWITHLYTINNKIEIIGNFQQIERLRYVHAVFTMIVEYFHSRRKKIYSFSLVLFLTCAYSPLNNVNIWEYRGRTMGVRWEYGGSTVGVRWKYGGSTVGVRWKYGGIMWEYHGSTMGVQWECEHSYFRFSPLG